MNSGNKDSGVKPSNMSIWAFRVGIAFVLAVGIFELGVNVGNGRIPYGKTLDPAGLNEVYSALLRNYDGKLTAGQLLNGAKSGLVQATGDPYTEYFTPAEAKDFNDEVNQSFSGIGVELGPDTSGDIEVIAPIDGSPAAKAGLKPQDIITAINGQTTSGMSIDTAVNEIRGTADTKVTLAVIRSQTQRLSFTITRANITVPSVQSKILSGSIGYMQISTFGDDTSQLALQAAKTFQTNHARGVILDLRDNPGGLVNAAVNVSSLWLPSGDTIMQEKRGNTVVQTYTANGDDPLQGIPTVVLVNGGSASASEITAGALHDDNAARIIGTTTFGKGVVQAIINLSRGAELKVTIASWYRPDGQDINHKGITPDQTVQLTDANTQAGNDTQLNAATIYLSATH
ncbi:MAG TPA: S41 family peptidase [Candidatus Saccharimonadales bacterium]|nr:S41 family peptidase [Candidatus Saccharimonadales bacterium]